MRSYPIWHDVTACNYKSSKSWGSINTASVVVYVGSSRANSTALVQHVTTKRADGDYTVFRFGVDLLDGAGITVIKTLRVHNDTKTVEVVNNDVM